MLFEPFNLKGVVLKNRVLRSSMGGRTSYFDGTVSPAWEQFETRFADAGVAAVISATVSVDDKRCAPLNYPRISDDRFIAPFRKGIDAVHARDCRYIMQIGDGGYHAQMSLFPKIEDSKTSSSLFDLVFGYTNRTHAMSLEEIGQTVDKFAAAARRARDAGCDGVEIAAHKGYVIQQFLNPGINRRTDGYGGTPDKRFRLLREVIQAVRRAVGPDYLVGVRMSAIDHNYLPVNLRLPVVFPLRAYLIGNDLEQNLAYGRELATLGVDYLHITSGFGFIHPGESPGDWPVDQFRLYANVTRHLSTKAKLRSIMLNAIPRSLARAIFGIGWGFRPTPNLDYAQAFRNATGLPVIANGGFDTRTRMVDALDAKKCDLIALGRPLLANPDLLTLYRKGVDRPPRPCSYCNRCSVGTAVLPLGCFDPGRFESSEAMAAQVMWWSGGPDGTHKPIGTAVGAA